MSAISPQGTPTYCTRCGKREVPEVIPHAFNKGTGEPETINRCPDACAHGWHPPELVTRIHTPMWKQVLSLGLLGDKLRCGRCGHITSLDGYF